MQHLVGVEIAAIGTSKRIATNDPTFRVGQIASLAWQRAVDEARAGVALSIALADIVDRGAIGAHIRAAVVAAG